MSNEQTKPRFGRKRKWYDDGGELHPLMAWAIVCGIFAGIPLLARAIQPWTGAVVRWLCG
jgi:hypothetical protein